MANSPPSIKSCSSDYHQISGHKGKSSIAVLDGCVRKMQSPTLQLTTSPNDGIQTHTVAADMNQDNCSHWTSPASLYFRESLVRKLSVESFGVHRQGVSWRTPKAAFEGRRTEAADLEESRKPVAAKSGLTLIVLIFILKE
jgi:hypothetical protein